MKNKTKSLKNKAAFGAKINKMNDETYALRRKVIDAIYELKKIVDLPRIEVRIVKGAKGTCGYAYLNQRVIHIEERYAKISPEVLLHLVAHEVVHAVTGFEHDNNCYLMQPYHNPNANKEKTIEAFKKYFK